MFMPMVMESIEEQLVQWYNRRALLLELAEALGKYASSADIEVFVCFEMTHVRPLLSVAFTSGGTQPT
jgi:hypothetical protein